VSRVAPFALFLVATLITGCVEPEAMELKGTISGPFFTADPVALPAVTVRDTRGQVMDPQPEVRFEVSPSYVARIEGTKLIPTLSGTAELRVTTAGVPSSRIGFSVQLVDDIEIRCPGDDCSVALGERIELKAYPLAGGAATGELPMFWRSDDPALLAHDKDGIFVARGAGDVVVTAGTGKVTSTTTVHVTAPTDRIIVTCEGTGESVEANQENKDVAAESACVLNELTELRLNIEAFAGAARAGVAGARWQSTAERTVSVDGGLLRGLIRGSAVVSVEVAGLRASFPVEVLDRATAKTRCGGPRRTFGRINIRERRGRSHVSRQISLRCINAAAVRCATDRLTTGITTQGEIYRATTACCCFAQ